MTGLLVLLQLAAVTPAVCDDAALTAMHRAQEHLARGDDGAALTALPADSDSCPELRLAALALRGWAEARALATGGGAVELQGPVQRTLEDLRALSRHEALALNLEYAEICIRAAIAAAQDERPEMELLITHARDLAERLSRRDQRALWPRSFNLVAGELWFEVDRYAESIAAYDRAVRTDPSAVALIGLARGLARLERFDEACAALRRVTDAASRLRAAAASDLVRCR